MSAGLALVFFIIISLVVDGVMAHWEAKRHIRRKLEEQRHNKGEGRCLRIK